MDVAIFVATTVGAAICWTGSSSSRSTKNHRQRDNIGSEERDMKKEGGLSLVDQHNTPLSSSSLDDHSPKEAETESRGVWCRATYSLVMHEPPHLFYEPRDWSCTTVLLLRPQSSSQGKANKEAPLQLPCGPLWKNENDHDSTIRHLKEDMAIDVCLPENCLHHLFTFPFHGGDAAAVLLTTNDHEKAAGRRHALNEARPPPTSSSSLNKIYGIWGDFYECVFRGKVEELQHVLDTTLKNSKEDHQKYSLVSVTLAEIEDALTDIEYGRSPNSPQQLAATICEQKSVIDEDHQQPRPIISFAPDTLHALKLYFQRQGDLRVQRRLLKGYSSADLEHYGLQQQEEAGAPEQQQQRQQQGRGIAGAAAPILRGFRDDQRLAAVDFTLRTDDGMTPRLLPQADLVLLGVSRAGKTPLSIFIAQTVGLKVANVPLVHELDPPPQLLVEQHAGGKRHRVGKDQVDPRRVFCLTLQPEYLQRLRLTRLRRELKKQLGQGQSMYATIEYVRKDIQKAKDLCLTYGFTEIDVTGRAMEETAAMIVSKLKERFPDEATKAQSVHVLL